MRIWITRAEPEASATADRLRALGHEPLVAPVLEVRPAPGPGPDLQGVAALAFTSRNGVRAFAALSPERALPAFAVGEATARAAREAGFARVESADGDVGALARLIAAGASSLTGPVLYLAPEEPAGDLVADLASRGVAARAWTAYRTQALELPPAAAAALANGALDAVLAHSARAARRLADYPELRRAAPRLDLFCISEQAGAPLAALGFRRRLAAATPTETSLLDLVRTHAPAPPPPRLFTPLYWIVLGLGLACILGAVLVASLGPTLFPLRRGHAAASSAAGFKSSGNRSKTAVPSGPP